MKGLANGDSDRGGVVGFASDEVPRRDCPISTASSGGRAVLKHGLQNGVAGGGLDRVEQEYSLAVIRAGNGRNAPCGGERRNGRTSGVGPVCICDPSSLFGFNGASDGGTADLGTVILCDVNKSACTI